MRHCILQPHPRHTHTHTHIHIQDNPHPPKFYTYPNPSWGRCCWCWWVNTYVQWDHVQVGRSLSLPLTHSLERALSLSATAAHRSLLLLLSLALPLRSVCCVAYVHTMAGHKICAFLIRLYTDVHTYIYTYVICVCACQFVCVCLFICQFVCEAATCFDNFFILLKWIELFCAYRKLRQLQCPSISDFLVGVGAIS